MVTDFIITIKPGASNSLNVPGNTGEYTLINAALDAFIAHLSLGRDLVSLNIRLILDCEAWVSTENVTVGSGTRYFTSDSTRYLWVRAKVGHRYDGTAGSSFTMEPSSGKCFMYWAVSGKLCDFLRIDGIEFSGDGGARAGFVSFADAYYANPIYVQNCIFHDLSSWAIGLGTCGGVYAGTNIGGQAVRIGNCLGYNQEADEFFYQTQRQHCYVVNCTGFGRYRTNYTAVTNSRFMNCYGKYQAAPSWSVPDKTIETNFNISGKNEVTTNMYSAGSTPGSDQCHANRPYYINSLGEQQDGSKADFILGDIDTQLKGEGYNINDLGGAYLSTVTDGYGNVVDILGNEYPPATSPTLWDVGSFTTYLPSYTVEVIVGNHGAVSPDGESIYTKGNTAVFQMTPETGYKVDKIYLDGVLQTVANTFSIVDIDADHKIVVVFIRITGFTLRYPITGNPTYEAVLRSPVKGDNLVRTTNANLDRLKLANLRVIRDKNWPIVKRYTYNFEALSQAMVDDLKTFIDSTTGIEILWIDYMDVSRYGYVVLESIEYARTRGDACSFDVALIIQESAKKVAKFITEGGENFLAVEDGVQTFVPEWTET